MDHPEKLGKYRLISLLATGGMGEVFLAKQEGPAGFSKTVVIKRILRHLASDQGFVEMFLLEARLAAMIAHPNVVQIFELGKQDESYFIAMEYVHGLSLRAIKQHLANRKEVFSPILAARVCAQALLALHYAHSLTDANSRKLNIVHRDVSPDNVLVSFGGAVKLVDFGIAKAQVGASTTRTGTLKGKYAYMAPEQISGGQVDCRADIYACGVLLYELLTGSRPYTALSEPGLIHAIMYSSPKDAREKNPLVPAAMNDLIMKALAKDPAQRFASAEEMATALEDFIHDSGETLNQAHIGAFLTELVGPAVAKEIPGNAPVQPPTRSTQALAIFGNRPIVPTAELRISSAAEAPTQMALVEPHLPSTHVARINRLARWTRAHWRVCVAALLVSVLGAGLVFWMIGASRSPKAPAVAQTITPTREGEAAPPPAQPKETPAPATAVSAAEPSPAAQTAPPGPGDDDETPPRRVDPPKRAREMVAQERTPRPRRSGLQKPGKVALRVMPWAEVFYKGKTLGITPMAPVELPAGKQTLVLRNRELGKQKKVNIVVQAGTEVPLKVDMFE
ncbi:MAG: serine/threonine protein kinase [Myxococcaceae bacterium]